MKQLSLKYITFLTSLIILSSCASFEGATNRHFGHSLAQPALELDSSPDSTGILAIEVSYSNTHGVTSISLIKVNPESGVPDKPIYAAPAKTPKPKRSLGSILSNKDFVPTITIFNGLKPGKYIIKSIRSYGVQATAWYSPKLFVDIKKGKVKYVGIDITIEKPFFGKATFSHTIAANSIREIGVWKKVQLTFPQSTWSSVIEDRISILK